MQFNPTLKVLLLSLPLVALVACSKNKPVDKVGQSVEQSVEQTPEVMVPTDQQLYAEEQARQLEELKKSNLIYFGFDKYEILPDFAQTLDAHAALLRDNPSYRITIEGHADERGTAEYNIGLGERRAKAVMQYLQGNGVLEEQMSIVSYGAEKPVATGHNEGAYAQNRRAVLVY